MVERSVRNGEAPGSIPGWDTKIPSAGAQNSARGPRAIPRFRAGKNIREKNFFYRTDRRDSLQMHFKKFWTLGIDEKFHAKTVGT